MSVLDHIALRERRALAACGLACALGLAGCAASSASGAGTATNAVGSVSVDGSQVVVRLDDDVDDGYTWLTSVSAGLTADTESAVADEDGKATFVYTVAADADATVEFSYVSDEDPSDVSRVQTLSVTSDADSNPTDVELAGDGTGTGTAKIVR